MLLMGHYSQEIRLKRITTLLSRNWNRIMIQILLTLVLALLVMLHVMRHGRNEKILLTGAMRIAEYIVESWIVELHHRSHQLT